MAVACSVLCLVVMAVGAASQCGAWFTLDDSLMFARYADHLASGQGLSWNPGEGAAYGPTSILYVLVVAMVRRTGAAPPTLAVQMASFLCGGAFLYAVWRMARAAAAGRAAAGGVVVLAGLAHATPSLTAHFTTGMDTAFAMAFLALYLHTAHEGLSRGRGGVAGAAALGGLAFLARPDLLPFVLAIPLFLWWQGADDATRRRGRRALLATAVLLLAQAAAAQAILGTPVPLSFYAKGVHGYGPAFAAAYRGVALAEFVDFVGNYWVFFSLVAADLLIRFAWWRSPEGALERGVLAATVAVLGYHLFMTLPIMPYKERFFHAALPGLAFLAARAVARLPSVVPEAAASRHTALALVVCVAGFLSPVAVASAKALRKEAIAGRFAEFDPERIFHSTSQNRMWFRLDRFSRLPDDLVIATTEVGLPAALNPGKRIIDLAGLNDVEFARNGFSADRLLEHDRPDVIYMPHPHYDRLLADLSSHERFGRDYAHYPAGRIGCTLGLALRRDSPHFGRLQEIAEAEAAPAAGGGP